MNDNEIKIAINNFKKNYLFKKIYSNFFILIIIISIIYFITNLFEAKKKFTIINQIKNPEFKTEKIMINPSITIVHDDNKIYKVRGSKAININNEDILIDDVILESKILSINAGELKIQDSANHLIFSKNPILILNP
jgi:hypothetical protein